MVKYLIRFLARDRGELIMPENWFAQGLRFTCTQCGDCCSGKPGFVWVNDEEIVALAGHLKLPEEEVRAMHTFQTPRGRSIRETANGDCIYYQAGKGCSVYEVRPRQCRSWPFWESNLESSEAWERTVAICPGAGTGELISENEIIERMRAIRL